MTNRYVFIYASVMVVVVALVLSTAATLLKPLQDRNIMIEKMQNILSTIEIKASRAEAETLFEQYIVQTKVVNYQGDEIEGDAFEINLQDENRKPIEERQLPVFIADIDGSNYYILPLRGTGLWGPVWGYISLENDLSTIAGANFDHASETPGLGAEIADNQFQNQFKGKQIFDEQGEFRSVRIVKGRAPATDPHAVDGITGGTITSIGVSNMLLNGLQVYQPYFEKQK
jgi:Na+-transporting NADH:ubiquinone oxidoreductase subunit C